MACVALTDAVSTRPPIVPNRQRMCGEQRASETHDAESPPSMATLTTLSKWPLRVRSTRLREHAKVTEGNLEVPATPARQQRKTAKIKLKSKMFPTPLSG